MTREDYEKKLEEILLEDGRYARDAYYFVADAVGHTTKALKARNQQDARHISGQQLLAGIRDYALEQFGPLALDVLADWGIRQTEDFGAIVFSMVDKKLLGASDNDSPADFANGYDFRDVFLRPFMSPEPSAPSRPPIDAD